MAQVQCEIDSIKAGAASAQLTLLLKCRDMDGYLPVWISRPQAEVLADQLNGRPDSKQELDAFLAENSVNDSDIACATIHLDGNTFFAKVLLSRHGRPYAVGCPIGLALALAVRTNSPILVDEALLDKAGVGLE